MSHEQQMPDVSLEQSYIERLKQQILEEAESVVINPQDKNAEGELLVSPEGPISKLTEQEWKIVRTETFKNWFGDWQALRGARSKNFDELSSDEKSTLAELESNTSKILSESGEPLRAYHETQTDFEEFFDEKIGSSNDEGYYGRGHYFSTTPGIEGYYSGEKRISLHNFLNIKNPLFYGDRTKAENPHFRYLLNVKPREVAVESAKSVLMSDIEFYKEKLKLLEAGTIQKHADIPKDADYEVYWEEQRIRGIEIYRRQIQKSEQAISELSKTWDVLNNQYDGVIAADESGALLGGYEEVVAFRADQVLIAEKTQE